MFDGELDNFKSNIDLRVYASYLGYQLDRKESSRTSAIMRQPATDDKVVIKRNTNGHYVYFSVRDDHDNGTIIDFVARRHHLNLSAVRKDWAKLGEELRPWLGLPPVSVPVFAPLVKAAKDRIRVETEYMKMQDAPRHPYLENERALPAELLSSERFAGRIRMQAKPGLKYPNAVFPHSDADGLCGYEVKNSGFTGFAAGGSKGLWLSHETPNDNRLVFCESAIDALSYAALFPDARARHASIGGKPNPEQPGLVLATIVRMPANSQIVAAMDADDDGRKLAGVVRQAFEFSGRTDLRFEEEEPFGFKDWNDQLRSIQRDLFPIARVSGMDLR